MANSRQDLGKTGLSHLAQRVKEFNKFWDALKEQATKTTAQQKILQDQLTQFRMKSNALLDQVHQYHDFLPTVPIASAIGAWIEEKLSDPCWKEHYANNIAKILEKNLLLLSGANNNFVTLDYFAKYGHQDVLEAIRCVEDWSLFEKEEIVRTYVRFSHDLSRTTQGLLPAGIDPDRERVRHKAIKYETFIDFVTHLSERDSLIAKLLYFGAMTIEEVLTLSPRAVNAKSYTIELGGTPTTYPKHVILEILAYIKKKEQPQKILFTNLRGECVERAHLNQSFARACEKMSKKEKITPGSLFRLELEQNGR